MPKSLEEKSIEIRKINKYNVFNGEEQKRVCEGQQMEI